MSGVVGRSRRGDDGAGVGVCWCTHGDDGVNGVVGSCRRGDDGVSGVMGRCWRGVDGAERGVGWSSLRGHTWPSGGTVRTRRQLCRSCDFPAQCTFLKKVEWILH